MRVTIVIPTYNERENLRPLVERISAVAARPLSSFAKTTKDKSLPLPAGGGEKLEWNILVVDDASPDGTGMLAEELAREGEKLSIRVLHRQRKEGLGAALLAGFERALADGADIIVQIDADGSHESSKIPGMIATLTGGPTPSRSPSRWEGEKKSSFPTPMAIGGGLGGVRYDLVVGSRRVPGGRIIGWGWHRRLVSWAAQSLSRHLLGLRARDVTSGFRAWRVEALRRTLNADSRSGEGCRAPNDSAEAWVPLPEAQRQGDGNWSRAERGGISEGSRRERGATVHAEATSEGAGTRPQLRPAPPALGYAFQVEMLHRAERLGLHVAEHPITFRDRERGRSKLGWHDVLGFFHTLRRLWINDHDHRFAVWLGLALIILTSLPYLYGWFRTPPGHVYTGVHALASGDMAVYGSYIEQVRDGRWLFVDLFTSEWPQRPLLNILWLPVGLLGRITGLSTVLTFHLARVLLIIPFILFLARFVAAFLKPREKTSGFFSGFPIRTVRHTALVFLAFSSGLGPLVADAIVPLSNARWRPGYDFWPPDLWVPESNTFLTLFQSPHFIVSLWLLLYVVLATLHFSEQRQNPRVDGVRSFASLRMTRNWSHSLAAGLAALVLFQFHPFYVPTVAVLLAVWAIVESITSRRIRWDLVAHGAIVGTISAPSVLYHLWLLFKDPITIVRANQNLLFTTHWWLVALSYGFLVPLALIGITHLLRHRTTGGRMLLVWLVTTAVLIYSPLTWQRRLIEGAHVVVVLIAMIGLFPLLARLHSALRDFGGLSWLHRYAWSLTTATIIAVPLLGISTFMNLVRDFTLYTIRFPQSIPHHSFYYPTDALDAMRWIRSHAQLGEATFAVGIDGHFLPMYTARQTVLGHGVETTHFVEKYETSYALTGGRLSPSEAREFLNRERVRYILITDASRNLWTIDPASIPGTALTFQNTDAEVYRLTNDE